MSEYFPQNISINQAIARQEELACQVVLRDEVPFDLKDVGGAMLHSRGNIVTAGIAVLDFKTLEIKKKDVVTEKVSFPVMPSCEGFREGKVLSNVITRFDIPDVFMIRGHGIAHPRRFGLASHVGLAMNIATIGISNQLMSGTVRVVDGKEVIFEGGDICGEVVKKEENALAWYVSPGHNITLGTAVEIVKKTFKSSMPEPLRVAQDALQAKLLKRVKNI